MIVPSYLGGVFINKEICLDCLIKSLDLVRYINLIKSLDEINLWVL